MNQVRSLTVERNEVQQQLQLSRYTCEKQLDDLSSARLQISEMQKRMVLFFSCQ